MLAGTAWSCFSIFSGITHCGAIAAEEAQRSENDKMGRRQRWSERLTLQVLAARRQLIGQLVLLGGRLVVFFILGGFDCIWSKGRRKRSGGRSEGGGTAAAELVSGLTGVGVLHRGSGLNLQELKEQQEEHAAGGAHPVQTHGLAGT